MAVTAHKPLPSRPTGKIVAAGVAFGGPFSSFALARYNMDGSLDIGFGTGGKVTTDFAGSGAAFAVALQTDGKIVAAGRAFVSEFALARYNMDGSLDMSFDTGGKVTTDFGGNAAALAVALQAPCHGCAGWARHGRQGCVGPVCAVGTPRRVSPSLSGASHAASLAQDHAPPHCVRPLGRTFRF
jgi:uncharacterized delta-60 repeat protein